LNLDKEKLILNEAVFSKAWGGQNGACPVLDTGGVWPVVVEASFCIDFTQFLLLFFIGLRGLTARAVRHWLLFHQGNREAA